MNSLIIYSPSGSAIAKVGKWEFHDTYMGEQYLTFTINSEKPIAWSLGCYCDYRGVRYSLNYIPSVTQKARKYEAGDAFIYDSVKLESPAEELTRAIMLDITATTGQYVPSLGTNYTGSAQFSLYCGETVVGDVTYTPVCALAAKIQANLDRLYTGSKKWTVNVDLTNTASDEKMLTFDNTTVRAALEMISTEFVTPGKHYGFSIVGRTITIGASLKKLTANDDGQFFYYGYGKGMPELSSQGTPVNQGKALYEIKRTSEANQKIVTRLRALGSTKNLPYRYYNKKYLNEQGETISQALHPTALQLPATFLPLGTPDDVAGANTKWGRNKTHAEGIRAVLGQTNDSYIDKNDDAANTIEGIREECARWDGSNSELEEIYPTIKEMTYGQLRAALTTDINGKTAQGEDDTTAYVGYGKNERVDVLLGFDDLTNYGDGLLADSKADSQGRSSLVFDPTKQTSRTVAYDGWTGNQSPVFNAFTINNVSAGKYELSPETQHVFVGANLSLGQHNDSVIGQMGLVYRVFITVNGTSILYDKDGNRVSYYESKEYTISNKDGKYTDMEVVAIPDSKDTQTVKYIEVSTISDVEVKFAVAYKWYKRDGETVVSTQNYSDTSLLWRVGLSSSQRVDTSISQTCTMNWYRANSATTYMNTEFNLYIKDFGVQSMLSCFNTSDEPVIAMTSGMCVGREFKIVSEVPEKVTIGGKTGWVVRCARAEDSALQTYYPSERDYITTDDTFVLLNVSMPDSYIEAAEIKLLKAATDYLADNCNTKYTYQPSLDDIYLIRDYDNKGEDSIYWNLYAGYKFPFYGIPDNDEQAQSDVIVELTIQNVTIKEGEGVTPKVEITLNDEVQQSTIQKLVTAVDRIYSGGVASSTGGLSLASVRNQISNYGSDLFVSKVSDDTVQGNIKFKKTVSSTNFVSGEFGSGWGVMNSTDGSHFESDYLTIRRSAFFRMLTIAEVKHIGGELILSAAACQLSKIETITITSGTYSGQQAYRCYFDMSANGKSTFNEWEVGDQAYCQVYRPKSGTAEMESMKFYWRLVVGVGESGDYYYIDLSTRDYATGSSVPEVNDNVVLLGSRGSDSYRRTAQVYSTAEANSPSRKYYANINSYSLSGKAVEIMENTSQGAHWRVGNDNSFINFENSTLSIKMGSKDVGEALGEKFDTYIDDVNNAPISSGAVVEKFLYNAYTYLPSYKWTSTEREANLGSFYLTKDGVSYKFIKENSQYYWDMVADTYLISAMETAKESASVLTKMGNDNVVTLQEKSLISTTWEGIKSEYTNVLNSANLYSASIAATINSYKKAYAALEAVMNVLLVTEVGEDSSLIDGNNARLFSYSYDGRMYSVTYNNAWKTYYSCKSLVDYQVNNATLTSINNVIASGSDINQQVMNELASVQSTVAGHTTSISALNSNYATLTNNVVYTNPVNGEQWNAMKGIITADGFATMFATAWDEAGNEIASALSTVYVATDPDTGIIYSGYKLNADQVNLSASHKINFTTGTFTITSDNFNLDSYGNVSMTGTIKAKQMILSEGSFYDGGTFVGIDLVNRPATVFNASANDDVTMPNPLSYIGTELTFYIKTITRVPHEGRLWGTFLFGNRVYTKIMVGSLVKVMAVSLNGVGYWAITSIMGECDAWDSNNKYYQLNALGVVND